MRFVDTSGLKSLGAGGAGPWRMGDSRLLRVLSGQRAIPTEEQVRSMLEAYRSAAVSGAGTPGGHEVVRIEGGYGVVVDYVVGVPLSIHVSIGSYSPREAGEEMGRLLRGLHVRSVGVGHDFGATFCAWARGLAPTLPKTLGARLVELTEAIPKRSCLLHGDMHVANVVVRESRALLIDLEGTGYGNPVFDLAIARSRALFNCVREAERTGIDESLARRVASQIWESLLEAYLGGAGAPELAEADRRIAVLCEVEHCGLPSGGANDLNQNRRASLATCARRLSNLLPRLDRLDLGDLLPSSRLS